MKLMIAGGGTGGHLFPGIALAEVWRERFSEQEVFFVGTTHGLEREWVPRAGFRLHCISQRGLSRVGVKRQIVALFLMMVSFVQSLRIILREKPDVAVGFGGYASGPVMLMAALCRVPTLIFEPNAFLGLTNRLLARVVKRVASPYDVVLENVELSQRIQCPVPVRAEMARALSQRPALAQKALTLLVLGGSQGASALNDAVMALACHWLTSHSLTIVHQTGARDHARVAEYYRSQGLNVQALPFIHDMAQAYLNADVVISRAGASTIAELALAAKPVLLVPMPRSADDHQRKNAAALAKAQAAVVLNQEGDWTPRLQTALDELLSDAALRQALSAHIAQFSSLEAAHILSDQCVDLVKRARG